MAGAQEEEERMRRRHRLDLEFRLPGERAHFAQKEVEVAAAQLPQQIVPVADGKVQAHVGMARGEGGGRAREDGLHRVGAAARRDVTGLDRPTAVGAAVEFVGHADEVARPLDGQATDVGRHGPAAGPLEHRRTEVTFERLDAARQGGLTQVECGRRANERAVLGDRQQVSQLVEINPHAPRVWIA